VSNLGGACKAESLNPCYTFFLQEAKGSVWVLAHSLENLILSQFFLFIIMIKAIIFDWGEVLAPACTLSRN